MAVKPQKFLLCFERTNAKNDRVWSVRVGRKWITGKKVFLGVYAETEWKGTSAKQPRAFIRGEGRVRHGEAGYIYIDLGQPVSEANSQEGDLAQERRSRAGSLGR